MWFKSTIRAEPYQFLYIINFYNTGVAWLSSVRAVKRLINFNKRTKLFCKKLQTAEDILEEGKNDVKSL